MSHLPRLSASRSNFAEFVFPRLSQVGPTLALFGLPSGDALSQPALTRIDLNLNVAPVLGFTGLDAPLMLHHPSIAIVEDVSLVGE
jgi:hypothetical protein